MTDFRGPGSMFGALGLPSPPAPDQPPVGGIGGGFLSTLAGTWLPAGIHGASPVTNLPPPPPLGLGVPPPPGQPSPPPPPGVPFPTFPGRLRPDRIDVGPVLERPPRAPAPEPPRRTATLLVQAAVANLSGASVEAVRAALDHIRAAQTPEGQPLRPESLMFYLERSTRVGEVLNAMASEWSESTRADFGRAIRVDPTRFDLMDAIVSIAILNHPLIDEEVLGENIPEATAQDLMDNRVVMYQYPAAGAQLQPPYVILVAVEYRQVAQGLEVVRQLMDQLAVFEGYKLPRVVVQRLGGG